MHGSPAEAPGKDSERRNATHSLEFVQMLLTWIARESQTEFGNLHTFAVNMDKWCPAALMWRMKSLIHESPGNDEDLILTINIVKAVFGL